MVSREIGSDVPPHEVCLRKAVQQDDGITRSPDRKVELSVATMVEIEGGSHSITLSQSERGTAVVMDSVNAVAMAPVA